MDRKSASFVVSSVKELLPDDDGAEPKDEGVSNPAAGDVDDMLSLKTSTTMTR